MFKKSPYASGILPAPSLPINLLGKLAFSGVLVLLLVTSMYNTLLYRARPFVALLYPTAAIDALSSVYNTVITTPSFQPLLVYIVPALISILSYSLYLAYLSLTSHLHAKFCRTLTIKNTDENYPTSKF